MNGEKRSDKKSVKRKTGKMGKWEKSSACHKIMSNESINMIVNSSVIEMNQSIGEVKLS
jgi:hypothetical protein